MSDDGGCLLAAYKQLEIIDISYDASTEENLLNSYRQSYSDASMIDFQKYYVNGFPVIRYIVAYTADGLYQYQGELIVFPSDILNCSVSAQIICEDAGEENAAHASIGGIAGNLSPDECIENGTFEGEIISGSYAGGIVCFAYSVGNESACALTISNCINRGNLCSSGINNYMGGIIGTVADEEAYSVKISNCSYTNADREVDDWNRFSADGNN